MTMYVLRWGGHAESCLNSVQAVLYPLDMSYHQRLYSLRQLELVSFFVISLRGFTTIGLLNEVFAEVYCALMVLILGCHFHRTKVRDQHYMADVPEEALPSLPMNKRWFFNFINYECTRHLEATMHSAYGDNCMLEKVFGKRDLCCNLAGVIDRAFIHPTLHG